MCERTGIGRILRLRARGQCMLQVIQFTEQHGVNNPGMFTYHHCAVLQITADQKEPIDAAWPKER